MRAGTETAPRQAETSASRGDEGDSRGASREERTRPVADALPHWGTFAGACLPRRRPEVHEYAVDGELLLLEPATKTVFHLNKTAVCIWRCCDGRPVDEVVDSLAVMYEQDLDTVRGHVAGLIDVLSLGGLVAWSAPGVTHG